MKKNRLIPLLLLKNGWLVQSKKFTRYQNLGNPITAVKRLSEWGSDELIYLDISKDDVYDTGRDDQGYPNRQTFLEIIEDVSKVTFMPITVGGKIRSLEDIEIYLAKGADKISINTKTLSDPDFITASANEFGAQCIVVSIDIKVVDGEYKVFSHKKQAPTEHEPVEWAKKIEGVGAGEILLNSIDRDGMNCGYDLELINSVSSNVSIPVIACGGVGEWKHLEQGLKETKADAVAAANIFHYKDQSVFLAKKYLFDKNANVRRPDLIKIK
jgi:cyclase